MTDELRVNELVIGGPAEAGGVEMGSPKRRKSARFPGKAEGKFCCGGLGEVAVGFAYFAGSTAGSVRIGPAFFGSWV